MYQAKPRRNSARWSRDSRVARCGRANGHRGRVMTLFPWASYAAAAPVVRPSGDGGTRDRARRTWLQSVAPARRGSPWPWSFVETTGASCVSESACAVALATRVVSMPRSVAPGSPGAADAMAPAVHRLSTPRSVAPVFPGSWCAMVHAMQTRAWCLGTRAWCYNCSPNYLPHKGSLCSTVGKRVQRTYHTHIILEPWGGSEAVMLGPGFLERKYCNSPPSRYGND